MWTRTHSSARSVIIGVRSRLRSFHVIQLAKRKAILDEGTFFSVLGSHICNASSGNENADYGDEHVSGNVKWDVVLSVTEQPSGTWLKSKFNLTHQSRYTAQYHGDRLDAEVTALIEPAVSLTCVSVDDIRSF